jgi:hypothetical protein
MANYNKKMREKRFAAGLCVTCGKTPYVENKRECESCKVFRSERQKREYHSRKKEFREKKKIQRDLWKSQGLCYNCGDNTDGKPRCVRCRNTQKNRILMMKDKCYEKYGYKCNCCGETIKQFLTLDHINNDGANHRKLMKHESDGSGKQLYCWIIKNNFPPIFQVLCYNCNIGKYLNGGICPHKSIA